MRRLPIINLSCIVKHFVMSDFKLTLFTYLQYVYTSVPFFLLLDATCAYISLLSKTKRSFCRKTTGRHWLSRNHHDTQMHVKYRCRLSVHIHQTHSGYIVHTCWMQRTETDISIQKSFSPAAFKGKFATFISSLFLTVQRYWCTHM